MKLLGFMLGVLFGYASIEVELCFFFSSRRRHTRWNCDWSSDVCSSDLRQVEAGAAPQGEVAAVALQHGDAVGGAVAAPGTVLRRDRERNAVDGRPRHLGADLIGLVVVGGQEQIGRASCRERV